MPPATLNWLKHKIFKIVYYVRIALVCFYDGECVLSAIAKLLVYLLGTESGWEGVE